MAYCGKNKQLYRRAQTETHNARAEEAAAHDGVAVDAGRRYKSE